MVPVIILMSSESMVMRRLSGPSDESSMPCILHREDTFTHGPVVEDVRDLIGLVREQCHESLEIAFIGYVPECDVAAEDAPPSIAFQIVAADRIGIDDLVEFVADFSKGLSGVDLTTEDVGLQESASACPRDSKQMLAHSLREMFELVGRLRQMSLAEFGVPRGMVGFRIDESAVCVAQNVVAECLGPVVTIRYRGDDLK